MIPFQKNEELNYVEAFLLSGISLTREPVLNVLVTWKDYSKLNTSAMFCGAGGGWVLSEGSEDSYGASTRKVSSFHHITVWLRHPPVTFLLLRTVPNT